MEESRLQSLLWPVLGAAAAAAYQPPPHHAAALAQFGRGDAPALFLYTPVDGGDELQVSLVMPPRFGKLLYLLRSSAAGAGDSPASAPPSCPSVHDSSCPPGASTSTQPSVGYLDGGGAPLRQLQALLDGVHLPHAQAAARAWPQQLRQDWAATQHAFSSTLCEAVHAAEGRTALYVPPLDEEEEEEAAGAPASGAGSTGGGGGPAASAGSAQRRALVQRLEVQLLRWTQQVRDVLNRHRLREVAVPGAGEGPAEELAFWRDRAADLGSLTGQLEGGGLARVLRLLEAARSPHLPAFHSARGGIAEEARRAASNCAHLAALEEPCAALAAAGPAQLAGALPGVLDALRVVWTLAPHYGQPDQMAGMLRRLSSAVVARCRAALDLPAILGGQPQELPAAVQRLEQCCQAAAAWRSTYREAAGRVCAALPARPCAFDEAAIFAHADAFAQRCRDLQEACAARQQFELGCASLAAVLGGPRAAEAERAVGEVRVAFAQQMDRLRGLPYDPLDVTCSAWYADVAAFRSACRDLDALLAGVLAAAAAAAGSLAARLDVIEGFARIATRDGLRKAVESCMADWHTQWLAELARVKAAFEGLKVVLPPGTPLPPCAGRVAVLRGLLHSIERTADHLAGMGAGVPAVARAAESAAAYEALHAGMQQYANNLNLQWFGSVPHDLASHLQQNLLRQDRGAGGLLAVALSPQLQAALEEAALFDRLRMGVPAAAQDLLRERQRLRGQAVGALEVARAYNALLASLAAEDRRLCRDRLRYLDRRVLPGVNKLCWASPSHQADFYHRDALRACRDTAAAVGELQAAGAAVAATAASLRDALLVRVERKRLFDLPDFEARQAAHQAATGARMLEAYTALRARLVALYARFAADGEEVQAEWLAWLRRADGALLEALTACVRRSLGEMARALQGDHRGAEVSPVFVLSVILDTNGRVELKPTLQQLFDAVHGACKAAVAVLGTLPRLLPDVLAGCAAAGPLPACLRDAEAAPPYVDVVGASEEAVVKPLQAVTAGVSGIVEKVQQVLSFFERKYQTPLWQTECSAYMRRYERANKSAAAFLADIQRYQDLREEVLSEDGASNVRWLRLDCSPLKQQLAGLAEGWVAAFSALLASLAARQLAALEDELRGHVAALTGQPAARGQHQADGSRADGEPEPASEGEQGVAGDGGAPDADPPEQQGEQPAAAAAPAADTVEVLEALHGRLEGEREELAQRLAACQEKYEALAGLQGGVAEEELERLDALPTLWAAFEAGLAAVPARLRELGG